MPILVTGGSGVIGLHVLQELAASGEEVVAYSTSGAPQHAEALLDNARMRVKFVKGNVLDFEHLLQTADKFLIDGIIHTAALTGEAQARARTRDVTAVNVLGTANVLEVARVRNVRRVIYMGSASEYGRRTDLQPIREEETNPEGMYAETKFLGHRLGQRHRSLFGLDVITVRVSSAYGPNTRFNPFRKLVGNTLIAHLCRAAAFGQKVELDGGAEYPRDWTYAADTARGICLAYHADKPAHTTYNIACGRSYMLSEVVAALGAVEPCAHVAVAVGRWDDDPFQAANLRGPLNIDRARIDLGYSPRYDLAQGLAEYIAWWRRVGDVAPQK